MLVTRAQVKTYMGLSGTIKYDSKINEFLPTVIDAVRAWCKRELEYEVRTKVFNGKTSESLILDLYPVVPEYDSKVWISSTVPRIFNDDTKLETNQFLIDPVSGIVKLTGGAVQWAARGNGGSGNLCWPKGTQNIQVEWAGGFWPPDGGAKPGGETIEDVPGGLREAIETIVADRVSRSIQLSGGQSQSALRTETIVGQQIAEYEKELDEISGFPIQAVAKLGAFRFSL